MKFTALILLLGALAVSGATRGHRVAVGSGTVGVAPKPVVLILTTTFPSPFAKAIFDINLPTGLDTNKVWTLQGSTNLVTWYAVKYRLAPNGWGVVTSAVPHEFYRLQGK